MLDSYVAMRHVCNTPKLIFAFLRAGFLLQVSRLPRSYLGRKHCDARTLVTASQVPTCGADGHSNAWIPLVPSMRLRVS